MGTWIAVGTSLFFAIMLLAASYGHKQRRLQDLARHRATVSARLDFATMGEEVCSKWHVKRSDFHHHVNHRLAALLS